MRLWLRLRLRRGGNFAPCPCKQILNTTNEHPVSIHLSSSPPIRPSRPSRLYCTPRTPCPHPCSHTTALVPVPVPATVPFGSFRHPRHRHCQRALRLPLLLTVTFRAFLLALATSAAPRLSFFRCLMSLCAHGPPHQVDFRVLPPSLPSPPRLRRSQLPAPLPPHLIQAHPTKRHHTTPHHTAPHHTYRTSHLFAYCSRRTTVTTTRCRYGYLLDPPPPCWPVSAHHACARTWQCT